MPRAQREPGRVWVPVPVRPPARAQVLVLAQEAPQLRYAAVRSEAVPECTPRKPSAVAWGLPTAV